MGSLILLILFVATLAALFAPWYGVVAGYFYILLGPQIIWWWSFGDTRIFLIIALCTLLGLFFSIFKGDVNFSYLANWRNFCLLIWLFSIVLSYIAGPYVYSGPGPRFFDPDYVISIVCKSFLFYFISVLCINDDKKFKYINSVMILVSLFYVYWINDRYFSGFYGRLGGPSSFNGSQYGDENNFAMFFVISLPFVYYYGCSLKNIFYKCIIWLIIPFGWHAIFLTGSRGGILGLCATMLVVILRSSRKMLALFLIPAFAIVFLWQGGPVMKERSSTLGSVEYEEVDASVQGRYDAWKAALGMMAKHPITGVGVASFGVAFPDFSEMQPRECHNTFLQIGAESGVIAMFGYIVFMFLTIKQLLKKQISSSLLVESNSSNYLVLMQSSLLSAWIGYVVCALFLSLQVFEQFFYLAVLSNYIISNQSVTNCSQNNILKF